MRRAAALAALPLLLLPACGDDDGAGSAATTRRPEPTTSTSVARPPATTSTTATTDRCDATIVPQGDGPLDTVPADADGDGTEDQVLVTVDDAGTWQLAVALGGDRGMVAEALSTVPTDHAEPAAARDLDGDGDDELLVVVGNGAAARIYGIFDLDGCDLEAVQLDGRPAELPVGGSVVELHGLRCEADGGLTVRTATSEDGVSYATEARTYALTDGTLHRTGTATGATTTGAADFPELSRFDC